MLFYVTRLLICGGNIIEKTAFCADIYCLRLCFVHFVVSARCLGR